MLKKVLFVVMGLLFLGQPMASFAAGEDTPAPVVTTPQTSNVTPSTSSTPGNTTGKHKNTKGKHKRGQGKTNKTHKHKKGHKQNNAQTQTPPAGN